MLVAFSISPGSSDADGGVHDAVAAAVQIVRDSGLPNRTDSMFTTIEGSWEECMGVVHECVVAMEAFGNRTSLVLKADIRPGRSGEMTAKLERLDQALDARRTEHRDGAVATDE